MVYYAAKILISAVLVVLASELSKRSTVAGAILASLPLVSVLAMIWLYADTRDVAQVAAFSQSIFWLVLPSLVLFLLLPFLLRRGYGFYLSFGASIGATLVAYWGMVAGARHWGLRL
ncbi:MAG TPA: DUF3147 family protein [Gammaproteobacteria bacterium]|nr:DUF3147 family protein [Gammaproteobacteria bacterium]